MTRTFAIVVLVVIAGCSPRNIVFNPVQSGQPIESRDACSLDEGFGASFNLFYYSGVIFGPVGEEIILAQRPEDMELLRAVLKSAGPTTPVVVDRMLPVRRSDYALLIAETIIAGGKPVHHSFGPYTAYEMRDQCRAHVLRRLFNDHLQIEGAQYVCLDGDGVDISQKVRRGELIP